MVKRARDLDGREDAIQEKSAEADAIIEITKAISQGVVDPVGDGAKGQIRAVEGREKDPAFKRAQDCAQRSPKGTARVTKAFRSGWSTMFKRAQEKAFKEVSRNFKSALQALRDVTTHLSKAVPTFEAGLPADVKSLPELVDRLRKAVVLGQVGHERSAKNNMKNNRLEEK